MNDESNVIKISKYIEMKSLINPTSYWQDIHNEPRSDIDNSGVIQSRKKAQANNFNKSFGIFLEEYGVEYGRVGLCAIAQLEQERFILRIPACDFFMKTILSDSPIGNFRCKPKSVNSFGYALLPKIEADVVLKFLHEENDPNLMAEFNIKALPEKLGTSPYESIEEIDYSELSMEGVILRHIEKYGSISRGGVSFSEKKESLLHALEKLESDSKIIRLIGTDIFIRLIPMKYHPSNLVIVTESYLLTDKDFAAVLKMESEILIKALCIIFKSNPHIRDAIGRNIESAIKDRQLSS